MAGLLPGIALSISADSFDDKEERCRGRELKFYSSNLLCFLHKGGTRWILRVFGGL
jgi:hypothetical protein